MAWPKGKPRPEGAGRKKGTPNRRTEALMDKCERLNIDPFEGLLRLTDHNDPTIALSAYKEVCQYIYPKRKALEITADVNMELAKKAEEIEKMPREQQIKMLEQTLKRLKGE